MMYRNFIFSKKGLGTFLYSPLDEMLVHRKVTPSIKFACTYLYTWEDGGTVRVKRLPRAGLEHGPLNP